MRLGIESNLIEAQDKIIKGIDEVLSRQRKPKTKESISSKDYKWGIFAENKGEKKLVTPVNQSCFSVGFLLNLLVQVADEHRHFLKMIVAGSLPNFELEEAGKVIDSLKRMQVIADLPTDGPAHAVCPVCPGPIVLNSIAEIKTHTNGKGKLFWNQRFFHIFFLAFRCRPPRRN